METRSSMYKMKPIYDANFTTKSTCTMYRMKNLMVDRFSENGLMNDGKESIKITADQLVERQTQLLTKLRVLSEEIEEIKKKVTSSPSLATLNKETEEQSVGKQHVYDVKECSKTVTKKVRKIAAKPVGESVAIFSSDWDCTKDNVVIHADPSYPPYSLLSLNYLYGELLELNITSYIHSTLKSFPDHLESFLSLKNNFTLPHINVILIWREVGKDCHLILSSVKHKVIQGEVNVLRFFDMMMAQKIGYNEWSNQLDTEVRMISTLDWAHQFRHFEGKRPELLALLEKRINERKWLVIDEDATIGDASVWSVLAGYDVENLQPAIRNWYDNCARTFIG